MFLGAIPCSLVLFSGTIPCPFWHFWRPKNSINFAKIFEILLRLPKIENSEFSKNYENIASNLNFYFRKKKTVPTRIFDQIVSYEFGMDCHWIVLKPGK